LPLYRQEAIKSPFFKAKTYYLSRLGGELHRRKYDRSQTLQVMLDIPELKLK